MFLADRASHRWLARLCCIIAGHLTFLPIIQSILHPGVDTRLSGLSFPAWLYGATAHPWAAALGLAAGGLMALGGVMLGGARHTLGRWLAAAGGVLSMPLGIIGLLAVWLYRGE